MRGNMAETAYLQLFYAPSAHDRQRFFEIRRCGAHVWSAEGGAHTWGKAEHIVCTTPAEADGVAAKLANEHMTQAFEATHAYAYAPDAFDYARFTAEIAGGLELFWKRLEAHVPASTFDRLALVTDSDVMTIGGSADIGSPDHSDERLYIPSEWSAQGMAELDAAYRMLLSKHRDIPFESSPPHHADNVLECMVRALESLRSKGVVGADTLLTVFISDNDQIAGMFERLNSTANAAKLEQFYGPSDLQLAISI